MTKHLAFAQKSAELSKEVFGEKHRYTIHSFHLLGFIYQELGRLDEALAWSEKTYRLRSEVLGKQHPVIRSGRRTTPLSTSLPKIAKPCLKSQCH